MFFEMIRPREINYQFTHAITVSYPYALAIMLGLKWFESRDIHPRKVLGKAVGIHVSKRWTTREKDNAKKLAAMFPKLANKLDMSNPYAGMLIGSVHVTGNRFMSDAYHEFSDLTKELVFPDKRYAWVLNYPAYLETPLPAIGQLGLWSVEGRLRNE